MSTLEILIAFAVLTLSMTAIIVVIFGNQSLAIDTQTNIEALGKAQALLEKARADAREDYGSVVSTTSISTSIIPYTQTLAVADLTECKKQATSTVSWVEQGRSLSIDLTTYISDIVGFLALGGDCGVNPPSGDWRRPQERSSLNIDKVTDIDVEYHLAFLTLNKTPASSADLAVVNVTSSTSPAIIAQINVKDEPGFNAIDVATSTDGHLYAYIANNNPVGQLLIMDVTNPVAPIFVASSTLPGITTGVGRSIFYYDKNIYIGTQFFVCAGCSELHIYDVSDPTSPTWEDSVNVNRNVNAIYVRGGLAYLATGPGTSPAHNPLKIFDIDPASPTYKQQMGSFTATGDEQGRGLHLVGNKLYLGLEKATSDRPEFFVLNISQPSSISTVSSTTLELNSGAAVTGVRIVGDYAFLGISDPNDGLQVRDISKPAIDRINDIEAFKIQQDVSGIDFADNTVYLSAFGGSTNFIIVGPGP